MTFLICLACLVLLITAALYACTKAVQGTSFADVFRRIGIFIRSRFNWLYSMYICHKNRGHLFLNLALIADSYANVVQNDLQLCKRCVLWQSYPIDQDTFFLSFKLMGLTKAYEKSELVELLTTELQSAYALQFGNNYPFVYSTGFDQNIIRFRVASNLNGNIVIQQQKTADYYADCNEPELLEDE